MNRFNDAFRALRRHKWASAALLAFVTLLAETRASRESSARLWPRSGSSVRGAIPIAILRPSGFVLYAAMIQARDDAERARAEYNERESALKGDALLEAQDRLRSAKVRYRQARLAFLPELARQCEQVKLPVPKEATEALAMLRQETRD